MKARLREHATKNRERCRARRIAKRRTAPRHEEACLVTMNQLAERWGVTRQAVQNCERRALSKLRKALGDDPDIREWLTERGVA